MSNQADYTYSTLRHQVVARYDADPTPITGSSEVTEGQITNSGALTITLQGVRDAEGQLVFGLGTAADAIKGHLLALGFSENEAKLGSVAAVSAYVAMSTDATVAEVTAAAKAAIAQTVPNRTTVVEATTTLDLEIAAALMGLSDSALKSLGFEERAATTVSETAKRAIASAGADSGFSQVARITFRQASQAGSSHAAVLEEAQQALQSDLERAQSSREAALHRGDALHFHFTLTNTGRAPIQLQLPTPREIQASGLTGTATVTDIRIEGRSSVQDFTLRPEEQVELVISARVGSIPTTASSVSLALGSGCGGVSGLQTVTILPPAAPLIDPFGRITGCEGEILPDYQGFSVGLYRPAAGDRTGDVADAVALTRTELPDNPNNRIPEGLEPNPENSNPFYLTNGDEGRYNFLFDDARGQLDRGQTYILMVNPPEESGYSQRRIRIVMGDRSGTQVSYTATSLDGRPISSTDNRTTITGTINVRDAERIGLSLAVLDFDTGVCQAQALQIVKTGDRAAAEPGDTVIYRLSIRNLATADVDEIEITDDLPVGFSFIADATQGEVGGDRVVVETEQNGSTITFRTNASLAQGEVLNIAYAAQVTPDALRGDGENSAIVTGQRTDNDWTIRDGPAIHRLRIQPGIVSDCGTIIGRVFVDRNFDGEQQPGEPGVPNAVIFMDDGNRITTDADGLFSLANVLPGYRTGALDLTSLPGYTLAPNHYFIERNSPSRLVHLQPGGMVRMNFAVTPTFQEGQRHEIEE